MTLSVKNKPGITLLLRIFVILLVIVMISGGIITYFLWSRAFAPNVGLGERETFDLYIPSGSDLKMVLDILEENDVLKNRETLEWLAVRKNYQNRVNSGRFRLTDGMSNNALINMLRSGNQIPVSLVFNNVRTIEDLAGIVSEQIEADSAEIASLAENSEFIESIGFDEASLPALFVPNTYEFFWNTSAEQFYLRMKREYDRFWNSERERKLRTLNMDRLQAVTLASIVIEETVKEDEMPVIAGVYINRIKLGMPLQADPTIKFALGNIKISRILRVDLEIDSPYNTYKHAGLPPGPIVIPPIQAIDAVLNAQEHDYIFFSAKEDFSGYHRFAKTLTEHNRNARLYQNALNERRVFR